MIQIGDNEDNHNVDDDDDGDINQDGNDEINTFLETITNLEAFDLKMREASREHENRLDGDKSSYILQ